MIRGRFRAWRFDYPGIDAALDFSGLQLDPSGAVGMVEEGRSVRQAILLLLSTVPGERVMRPSYGCRLHELVFDTNDATTQGLAIHYVRQALLRWEPRIEIIHLDASANQADPGKLVVTLHYRLKGSSRERELAFSLSLTGD